MSLIHTSSKFVFSLTSNFLPRGPIRCSFSNMRTKCVPPSLALLRPFQKQCLISSLPRGGINTVPSKSLSKQRPQETEIDEDDGIPTAGYSGMSVIFLGTSSNQITMHRSVSSVAVRLERETWIVDAGEGTLVQVLRSGGAVRLSKISRIFITHMHADHVWGLPALLAEVCTHARSPVHVYGPAGVRDLVKGTYKASQFTPPLPIFFHEIYERSSPECGPNDFVIPPSRGQLIFEDESVEVHAGFIEHSIACWGFIIKEKDAPGNLLADRCVELGIPRGPLWKLVRSGRLNIIDPDGKKISPDSMLSTSRKGRKLAILGDTHDPHGVLSLCRDADVLIHECTLPDAFQSRAAIWGHSTPTMAGEFARKANVKNLVLTHFSPRFHNGDVASIGQQQHPAQVERIAAPSESSVALTSADSMAVSWPTAEQLAKRAAQVFGGPVVAARDFMQIDVPLNFVESSSSTKRHDVPPPVYVDFALAQGHGLQPHTEGALQPHQQNTAGPKPLRVMKRKTWF